MEKILDFPFAILYDNRMRVKEYTTKLIYLIRGDEQDLYEHFHSFVTETAKKIADEKGVGGVKITITVEPPPRCSVIPFRKDKISAVSIWSDSLPSVGNLFQTDSGIHGFLVTEALPVSYEKDWEDEEMTPGAGLLTIFKRRKGLSREEFVKRWHESHTPLSLKVHPLWNYNRNVVEREIGTDRTSNENTIEGIVEEHFKDRRDLLNVFRFFGPPWIITWRMIRVLFDSRSFIDYPTMEPYFIAEQWIKTPADFS